MGEGGEVKWRGGQWWWEHLGREFCTLRVRGKRVTRQETDHTLSSFTATVCVAFLCGKTWQK